MVPHRIIWSWYTGRWWVGCYIWYSKYRTGRGRSPPRPLLVETYRKGFSKFFCLGAVCHPKPQSWRWLNRYLVLTTLQHYRVIGSLLFVVQGPKELPIWWVFLYDVLFRRELLLSLWPFLPNVIMINHCGELIVKITSNKIWHNIILHEEYFTWCGCGECPGVCFHYDAGWWDPGRHFIHFTSRQRIGRPGEAYDKGAASIYWLTSCAFMIQRSAL